MLNEGLSPYHIFSADGYYFAIDRYVPAYLEIDQTAFEGLTLLHQGLSEEAVRVKLSYDWGHERVSRMFASSAAMREATSDTAVRKTRRRCMLLLRRRLAHRQVQVEHFELAAATSNLRFLRFCSLPALTSVTSWR